MSEHSKHGGLRAFLLIWFGQLVSLIGSGLTTFALGVWVFQGSGSVTQFALVYFFTQLPGILLSPIAGALVDRWDRRRAMILSDSGAAGSTLFVFLLLLWGHLEVWHVYLAMAINSIANTFQWPAYSAATTLLVDKRQFARATGLVQTAQSLARVASPVLAGALMTVVAVHGVILIDFVTFLFALSMLAIVRIPRPQPSGATPAEKGCLWREAAYGWTFIKERSGLVGLLLFFTVINFTLSTAQVLLTPMVLRFTSPAVLGTILSAGGLGMLVGSLVMSAWGGPKRRIVGVLGFAVVAGIGHMLVGIRPSALSVTCGVFLFFFSIPFINSCSQAIWQAKVPPDLQGRVFAIRRMVAWAALPLAYLIAGPLADYVFEPLLAVGGRLAESVGQLLGVGPGRGIGLIFIVMGTLTIFGAALASRYRRLFHVEAELPDMVDVEPEA